MSQLPREEQDGEAVGDNPNSDNAEASAEPSIEDLKIANAFIQELKTATLKNSKFGSEAINRLRNPTPDPLPDFLDPFLRLSLDIFLATENSSERTYHSVREAICRCYPADADKILTLAQVKQRIAELTGVFPILEEMCPQSCVAFTGPFKHLDKCPVCQSNRYDQKRLEATNGREKIARTFPTFPIGPQLQAILRSPKGSKEMQYRAEFTRKFQEAARQAYPDVNIITYEDLFNGSEYLQAVLRGDINDDTITLLLSLDGAQLYAMKQSDCWMYIWVILERSPDQRYKQKHVLPGGVIPGPNKPKNLDSFLFPGIHHLSAIQKEGLIVPDMRSSNARLGSTYCARLYLLIVAADGPGMAAVNGFVGHHGGQGCRLNCPMKGRHKPGSGHYFPVALKPHNYSVTGCDHEDVSLRPLPLAEPGYYQRNLHLVMGSRTQTSYERNRLITGIVKPTLLSGLAPTHVLGIPACFAVDMMHLIINLPEHLVGLWRGTLYAEKQDSKDTWDWAVLKGDLWEQHGAIVGNTGQYLPGSFDRTPRNPALKISSGYKAWEYLMYVFGLGPAVFFGVLPDKYWSNFCKLVFAIRCLSQRQLTSQDIRDVHVALTEFVEDFELLYYQRNPNRLHFVRQSIHLLLHLAHETVRMGPLCLTTQWTMERFIGDLGSQIRQHSNYFANLNERCLRRCRVNSLKAMFPVLDPPKPLPHGSIELENGYILLRAQDQKHYTLNPAEMAAMKTYLSEYGAYSIEREHKTVIRLARLRLPNGQTARSAWKELVSRRSPRNARMVKVRLYHDLLRLNPKSVEI